MVSADHRFSFDYAERLPVAIIGAGDRYAHYILPCLRYLPFDLVAIADTDRRRGMAIARQCGAQRFYPDHQTLLEKEQVRAILVSLPLAADGSVPYAATVAEALSSGAHVWADAPAASLATHITKQYTDAALKGRSYLMAGYRRPFMPGYEALKTAIEQEKLKPSAFDFWCALPVAAGSAALDLGAELFSLLPHPLALLTDLFGEAKSLQWLWHTDKRGITLTLTYASGLVGSLQCFARPGSALPHEALTVYAGERVLHVSEGLTLVQEQPEMPSSPLAVRCSTTGFTAPQSAAGGGETTGYLGALRYFAEALLKGAPIGRMSILHLLQVMSLQAAIRSGRERQWVSP